MTLKQAKFISLNKDYVLMAAMYSPILFLQPNVVYFKIYGKGNYAACFEDGTSVKWQDNTEHEDILKQYNALNNKLL